MIPTSHIPPRERIGGIETLRLAVLVLICLAIAVTFVNVRHLDTDTLKNRAVNCRFLDALHLPLPAVCSDPRVLRYER